MLFVVLIPLIVMVLACALERFEARAIPGDTTRRAARASRTTPPPAPAERPRHLSLVRGTGEDAAPGDDVDPQTLRLTLPKAS